MPARVRRQQLDTPERQLDVASRLLLERVAFQGVQRGERAFALVAGERLLLAEPRRRPERERRRNAFATRGLHET
ncbi:hypothetical protein [Halorubellus litoreus]|uniref:Uncharacterized protein n=1 Tax=Halorubellus litoreus TaxID=755308 RepID=A0ABD5VM03_9EURY